MKQKADNLIAQNKKASHDYFIKETLEAGIALTGTEIKSIRARRINLRDGYVQIINGSAFLENVHISEYKEGNRYNCSSSWNSSSTGNGYYSFKSLFKAWICQGFNWCRTR